MKIYIAGSITGNRHYKSQFRATEEMLQRERYAVLNPAELPAGMKPADYMRICIAMEADFPDVSDDTIRTVAEVAEFLRNSPVAIR